MLYDIFHSVVLTQGFSSYSMDLRQMSHKFSTYFHSLTYTKTSPRENTPKYYINLET